jgi:hypothetical protein
MRRDIEFCTEDGVMLRLALPVGTRGTHMDRDNGPRILSREGDVSRPFG